jgi:glycosyltransferase involved in cell wall biosynthesis
MTIQKKIAVFHAFFVPKGGGEMLIFAIRNHYHASLFTGAIDHKVWDKEKTKTDSFVGELYNEKYDFTWLHEDSKIPFWRKVLRQLQLKYNPKVKKLNNFDVVIFSGNIAGVAGRITNPITKKIVYCHTPPRPFTDQFEKNLSKIPILLQPLAKLFRNWVLSEYKNELKKMDLIVTNSYNIQKRLKTYTDLDSVVIHPAVDTSRFTWIEQGDYFLSYARLEDLKRIPLIVDAFSEMSDKKLVICSSGPLADWVKEQTKKYTNIEYRGLVSNSELEDLIGGCLAGIYIPEEEDFGIIQCELMAAGKPVIGVAEGGLLETVIDGKTGVLIPANPTTDDLKKAIVEMTPEKALVMKLYAMKRAKDFDSKVFFEKMDNQIERLI